MTHSFETPYYNHNGQCTVHVKCMSKKKDHFTWTNEKLRAILDDIDGYEDQLCAMLKNKSLNDAFLKKKLRNYQKKVTFDASNIGQYAVVHCTNGSDVLFGYVKQVHRNTVSLCEWNVDNARDVYIQTVS